MPGSIEHFVEYKFHPLQSAATAADVRAFAWPDVTADYRYEGLAERVAEYHRRGYAVTGELYQTIFERAWLMRGMEQLLIDFLAAAGDRPRHLPVRSPICASSRPGGWPPSASTSCDWATTSARKKGR